MISFALDETQVLLRETAAQVARERIRPALRETEDAGAVAEGLVAEVAELGLATVTLPEAMGGAGLDLVTRCLVEEELAWGDPGVAAALSGPGAGGAVVLEAGGQEQVARLLGPFGLGEPRFGALAHSDADASEPTLSVAVGAGGWRVRGRKAHVIHGGRADLLVVTARSEDGSLAAFAVSGGAKGLWASPRRSTVGWRAVPVVDINLDDVSAERLEGGGEDLQRGFGRLAVTHAARELGCARACLDYALEYGQDRTAFGRPIAHFQANAFILADLATEVDAGRWLLWRAARALDARATGWRGQVALAAAHIRDALRRSADETVQLLGGHGYIQDHPPEKWMRDARTMAQVGLPTDVLREWRSHEVFGSWGMADPSDTLPTAAGPAVLT